MEDGSKHEHFCFAGRPALCKGYFPNDVLPCICGVTGNVLAALSALGLPAAVCDQRKIRTARGTAHATNGTRFRRAP